MTNKYTEIAKDSIYNFAFVDEYSDAIEYLNNPDNFRPFNEGLTELLMRAGYPGDINNDKQKTRYLYEKMTSIGSNIEQETIKFWFSGKHRPKIEPASRKKMYEICFALDLQIDNVKWFFHHVYYDRCFNCHNIDEAAYLFCFLNNLSYIDATQLIQEISDNEISSSAPRKSQNNYTQFIQSNVLRHSSKNEFLEFMKTNKLEFDGWNISAVATINNLLNILSGFGKTSASDIDKLKRLLKRNIAKCKPLNPANMPIFDNCGLLLYELYYDASVLYGNSVEAEKHILESISSKSVLKNNFILERLLSTSSGITKDTYIPYIVKVNFPSKKSLSDILIQDSSGRNKIESSKSYDTIRKVLVLLHFYTFWLPLKFNPEVYQKYDFNLLFEIYQDDANRHLLECGYEELYPGNPYDWLFLTASNNESPLEFFRFCVSEIIEAY